MIHILEKLRPMVGGGRKGISLLGWVRKLMRRHPSISAQTAKEVVAWLLKLERRLRFLFYDVAGKIDEEISSVIGLGYYLSMWGDQQDVQTLLPCLLCLRRGDTFHYLTLRGTRLVCNHVTPPRCSALGGYKSELIDFVHYASMFPDMVDRFRTLWKEYVTRVLDELEYNAETPMRGTLYHSLIDNFSPLSPYASHFGVTVAALVYIFRVGIMREFIDVYFYSDIVSSLLRKFEMSAFSSKVVDVEGEEERLKSWLTDGYINNVEARAERIRLNKKCVEMLTQFLSTLDEKEFDFILTFARDFPNFVNFSLP